MKTLFFSIIFATSALAQTADCPPEENLGDKIASHIHEDRLSKYAQAVEDKYKVIKLYSHPNKLSPTSLTYDIKPNIRLKPGECAYFSVPESLRNSPVLSVTLGHKQASEDNTGWNASTKYDDNPGLTTVQLNKANEDGKAQWRFWNGSASGDYGAKFAEPRYDLEIENLYEWYHHGHSDVATNTKTTEILKTDAMRLCSIGKDPVTIGLLNLKVFPGGASRYTEYNFGEGNLMGDSLTAEGRNYGELKKSIVLNGPDNGGKLPEGWTKTYNSLSIPIATGKKIKSFEVAVSDTHAPTLAEHDDGQQTTSGYGRLTVVIKKKDGTRIPIISYENVPPRGLLVGAPEQDSVFQEGDQLIIEASSDKVNILGLKIGID